MQESNAYTNTGDTVPANSLPTPEASLAQQLKLEETLTCLDRGDTLSPLRGLYAVADQAGDQWVRPQLCHQEYLHVPTLSCCKFVSSYLDRCANRYHVFHSTEEET